MYLSFNKELRQKQIKELSEYKLVLRLLISDPCSDFSRWTFCSGNKIAKRIEMAEKRGFEVVEILTQKEYEKK